MSKRGARRTGPLVANSRREQRNERVRSGAALI
jgi:hypothetical protein